MTASSQFARAGIPELLREDQIIARLEELGAFRRKGHFVYASRLHGAEYLDKSAVLANDAFAEMLARTVAVRWLGTADAPRPEVVAGPAKSGAKFAVHVAEAFNRLSPGAAAARAVSVDKDGDAGFRLSSEAIEAVRGRSILMVEDIRNTGQSLLEALRAVRDAGGKILGAAAIWNRGGTRKLGLPPQRCVPRQQPVEIPFFALVERTLLSYQEDSCPYCKVSMPINTELGHGAAYVARHGQPRPS